MITFGQPRVSKAVQNSADRMPVVDGEVLRLAALNSGGDVTLAGENYITISGQVITVGKPAEAQIALSDNTTLNVSTARHGFTPKLDNNPAHFLNGQGGYTAVYSTGTFTPADGSAGALSLTVNGTPYYIRIGPLVVARFSVTYPATADTHSALISGLPFATVQAVAADGAFVEFTDRGGATMAEINNSASTLNLYDAAGALLTNANVSGKRFDITAIYNAG